MINIDIKLTKKAIHIKNTSPIMRHKITRSVKYNWWIKCLDTQHNELTNQNLIEVPKVVQPTKKTVII